jgi:IS5 family transposase
MRQTTLATAGFDRYAKTTRRDVFLAEMEAVVPWAEFCSLIDPVYPKAGNGRRPVGLERMLRIYFLQQWIDLSDPGAEESLYDSHAMRRFVGIDLGREPVPDETTICNFRHLLERHDRGRRLFETVHEHLERRGIKVARGTIVDATIISAPSSTKNAAATRDPDMCQTRKGASSIQRWQILARNGPDFDLGRHDAETMRLHERDAIRPEQELHEAHARCRMRRVVQPSAPRARRTFLPARRSEPRDRRRTGPSRWHFAGAMCAEVFMT